MVSLLNTLFKPQAANTVVTSSLPVSGAQTADPTCAPAMQGDISAITLENVFQLCDFAALTGKLEIESPSNCGIFYFRNGTLIHGLLRINQRKIGQLLLEAQVITQQQLDECLRLHQQLGADHRLGQILLKMGYIKPGWLDKSLLAQVKEAFFETLSWQEGTFKFYPNQAPTPDTAQFYTRIDHLLLEGMVALDDQASPGDDEEE